MSTARMFGHILTQVRRSGFDLLFPPICSMCGVARHEVSDAIAICGDCRQEVVVSRDRMCGVCGSLLRGARKPEGGCSYCRDRRFSFEAVRALGVYGGELRRAVLKMKRLAGEPLALAMGRLLMAELGSALREWDPDVVVPIPMHAWRRMLRQTSSADLLVEVLAPGLGIPGARRLLARRRNTRRQSMLLPAERSQNIRGAFRVRTGYDLGATRVLLVDDILTTGATCHEAAKVLRDAGASAVLAIVIARAENAT